MDNNTFSTKVVLAAILLTGIANSVLGQDVPITMRQTASALPQNEIKMYFLENDTLMNFVGRSSCYVKKQKEKFLILFTLDIPYSRHEKLQRVLAKKLFDIDGFSFIDALILYRDQHDEVYDLGEWKGKGNFVEIQNRITSVYKKRFVEYTYRVKRTVRKFNKNTDDALPKEVNFEHYLYDSKTEKIITVADILTPEAISKYDLDATSTDITIFGDSCFVKGKSDISRLFDLKDKSLSDFTEEFKNFIIEKRIEEEEDKKVWEYVEDAPTFPGGDVELIKWLSNNIQYPKSAKIKGVQGRVIVKFVVKKDGTIDDAKVVRSVDPLLDKEALRVVKAMPQWTPGKHSGKTVAAYRTLPISFTLQEQSAMADNKTAAQTDAESQITKPKKDSEIVKEKPLELEVVDVMPSFPGGDAELFKWLSKNIKYPAIAEENGVQGRVMVKFAVDKDGSIYDPKVLRSVDPSLDKEALRVVKAMPRWIPAKKNGHPVSVYFTLPVTFQLQ